MPYLQSSDGTLVLLTLSGDTASYDELVRRHEKQVRGAAYAVIHNAHIAEDAAQDAFLAAWLKLDRLREPEKFGIWVCRIARNCAVNMAHRFRSYLSLEDADAREIVRSGFGDPEQMLMTREEAGLMRQGLRKLPQRAKQVVYLHYYEEMSAEQIARLMGVSVGTVKSQLHEGRRRMRKELCAMDEKLSDTLLQKIQKKIDEVKSWQYKNSKEGFERVYSSVCKDIDAMPECQEKYRSLADVLIRGYWWLPGEKNDRLFERIREAARLGRNNEVMSAVLARECCKYWGEDRISHIRNVQIPSLDPGDFRLTLAERWMACGREEDLKNREAAMEAFDRALALLTPADALYYYGALQLKEAFAESAADEFVRDIQNRRSVGEALEISLSEGIRISGAAEGYTFGELYSYCWDTGSMLHNLLRCDGWMTAPIKPGESVTASDGSTLTFEAQGVRARVPAGEFADCQVWTSRLRNATYRNWLKRGVGLVRQEVLSEGVSEAKVLRSYGAVKGDALLPLGEGSFWEYESDADPEAYAAPTRIEVRSFDGKRAVVTLDTRAVRKKYDENSWLDMILKTRADYLLRLGAYRLKIQDVKPYAERAAALAKTPYEKAHADAAYSAVKRIIETDPEFNPDGEAVGCWNFFNRNEIEKADGRTLLLQGSGRYSFEWKRIDGTSLCNRLLSNHIYSILQDTAGCLWDEQWKSGYEARETRDYYGAAALRTRICCEDAGTVQVPAGSFESCLAVEVDCDGMDSGHAYRGGRRTYYFAPEIGLVKVEIPSRAGLQTAYELTSWEGRGQGYMPFAEGMRRRYEDLGLTDGYEGAAEYTCARDCQGRTVVFFDATGIRHKPQRKITRYDAAAGELRERQLEEEEKYDEANLEGCCNAVRILLHQLTKGYHAFGDAGRRAERYLYNLRLMEAAGNGRINPALWARASRTCLLAAAAFMGAGRQDEGYRYLELALTYAEQWKAIPEGEKIGFGEEAVFGGIVYLKGKSLIELPDGSRREIEADGVIDGWLSDSGAIYACMTVPQGWEWFDPVRGQERYKKLTERAKRLAE